MRFTVTWDAVSPGYPFMRPAHAEQAIPQMTGLAIFTAREVAEEFSRLLSQFGWEDTRGQRHRVTVSPVSEIPADTREALESIPPQWCFPS